MPAINAEAYASIAETISSVPGNAYTELIPYDDGSVFARLIYGEISSNRIYYFHQPGNAASPNRHDAVMLQASLGYSIGDNPIAAHQWTVIGPDDRSPHYSNYDSPTGKETYVEMSEYIGGKRVKHAERFSTNPDRTYKAMARLARMVTVHLASQKSSL